MTNEQIEARILRIETALATIARCLCSNYPLRAVDGDAEGLQKIVGESAERERAAADAIRRQKLEAELAEAPA